jgi:hypothetical protein
VPFYKRLADRAAVAQPRPHVLAICLETADACKAFVSGEGLRVDAAFGVPADNLRVRGTPTLLLVDSSGRIARIWKGRLTDSAERDVMNTLFGAP